MLLNGKMRSAQHQFKRALASIPNGCREGLRLERAQIQLIYAEWLFHFRVICSVVKSTPWLSVVPYNAFQRFVVNRLGLGQRYGVLVYTRTRDPRVRPASSEDELGPGVNPRTPVMISVLPELIETQVFVRYLGLNNYNIQQCSRHLRAAQSHFNRYGAAHPLISQATNYLVALDEF